MGTDSGAQSFVAIGLGEKGKSRLQKAIDITKVKLVDSQAEFEGFIDGFELQDNATILAGSEISELSASELGQTLRACYINANIVFVTWDANNFTLAELKKNGFSKAFLMPMDENFFTETAIAACAGSIKRKFKAVKMLDISPAEHLEFGVYAYMPLSQKHVLLTAGGSLSEKKYQLLKDKTQTTVFVDSSQVEKFYDYAAEKLAKLAEGGVAGVSETERTERLKQSVQGLFHNILDQHVESNFESGRDLLEQSHQVVQKFVESKAKVNLKEQIAKVLDVGSDSYSHAQSVSSLACLLSLSLGIGNPEELAIAGLFHDIAVNGFETEPNPFNLHELSELDLARFKKHPMEAVQLLKNKKLTLTPAVVEIIEKHHERIDGKGFPAGLPAHKIPLSAQLLSFCDDFEYLMRPTPGKAQMTPLEATEKIHSGGGLSVELTSKVKKFFVDLSSPAVTAA